MTSRAQALLQEALALPVGERADVAAELLASLTNEAMAIPDWHRQVLDERLAELTANPTAGRSWDQVRADLLRAATSK